MRSRGKAEPIRRMATLDGMDGYINNRGGRMR